MQLQSFSKGESGHPGVILIHGLLGSGRNLIRMAQELAAAGFHTVAYDQRGHGRSPHVANHDYPLSLLAEDVFSVMDTHGLKSAHLVGHSLGGRVALAAAALHPERVKSISMLDVGLRIHPAALAELKRIIDPLPPSYPSRSVAESSLAHIGPALQQFLVSNLRADGDKHVWAFDLEGIRTSLIKALQVDQSPAWAALKMPALVVRGGKSLHFLQTEMDEMLARNPRAGSALIMNAGHWLHVDNFVDTVKAVLDFLKKSEGS